MGIDCLLVSTNQVEVPYPVYPLGLAHLAGALEGAGHRVVQFDLLAQGGLPVLEQLLADFSPDLIGVSIRNLDTVDSTCPDSFVAGTAATMACLRKLSKAPVVLGGPAFSILPTELLELLQADYGIAGEGEELLLWLARSLEEGTPPAKGLYRASIGETAWPAVTYNQAAADFYLQWGGMLNIQTKRGCPYRCGYCSYPAIEGRQLRFRDPESVAEEVTRVTRELGARYIFFTDSVFNDPQGHYLQVAEALIKAGNTTPWCAYFRPQHLTKEGLTLLKQAGLAAMEVGTDAVTEQTLEALGKGFGFQEVVRTSELASALEIPCAHFVIFGGPEEDERTLAEGLANIETLPESVVFGFTGIRILPETAIYGRAVAEGCITAEQPLQEPVFYFSPKLAQETLDTALREAWAGRFNRIYPCQEMQNRIRRLHERGHTGPMWDFLVRKRGAR